MVSPKYRVQCCTYNGHLGGTQGNRNPDLTSWLIPTLAEGSQEYSNSSPPDIVAIGFQEMIPLHLSLLGLTKAVLNEHDYKLKAAIESHAAVTSSTSKTQALPETYTLMAKKVLGGIALLVYTRDLTITNKVVDVRVATAACGVFRLMGNKGGVGVRISVDDISDNDDEEEDEVIGEPSESLAEEKDSTGNTVYTFVTAHLAAHDHGLQRRNEDYRSIVERLVFSHDGPSEFYQPSRSKNVFKSLENATVSDAGGIQIYDTSYLFFFGDLNYRISTKSPRTLGLPIIAHKIANDLSGLLLHDQLHQAQSTNSTLHYLQEGPITFKPTYKYKPGTISEFKKFTKRVPGWCDRVLWATWADGEDGAGKIVKRGKDGEEKISRRKGPKTELYRSVMSWTGSDHKPVTSIIALPRHPQRARALRLPFPAPFAIDPLWRRQQLIGYLLDRFVGFFWCLIMLAGLNRDARIGIFNLGGAALAAWYYM